MKYKWNINEILIIKKWNNLIKLYCIDLRFYPLCAEATLDAINEPSFGTN